MNLKNKIKKDYFNNVNEKSIGKLCEILKSNNILHCIDYNLIGDTFINVFFTSKYYALLSISHDNYLLKNEDIESSFSTEHELVSFIKKESHKINNKIKSKVKSSNKKVVLRENLLKENNFSQINFDDFTKSESNLEINIFESISDELLLSEVKKRGLI